MNSLEIKMEAGILDNRSNLNNKEDYNNDNNNNSSRKKQGGCQIDGAVILEQSHRPNGNPSRSNATNHLDRSSYSIEATMPDRGRLH